MEGIKNCPCCGGEGKLKDVHGRIRHGWVGCPACRLFINWNIDPAGAIRAWNRRTVVRVDAPIFDREEHCPLVPVPPHGRLLKVLKTERECVSRDCDRNCGKCDLSMERSEILSAYNALIAVLAAPTIIPADKGETE